MPFQRLDTGLVVQTPQEVRDELSAAAVDPNTGIDPELDTSDNGVLGRLFGVLALREADLQKQIQAVYTDLGIGASGDGLTRVAALTGTIRSEESYSTVSLILGLAAGATVPAGKQITDTTGATLWAIDETVSNPGLSEAFINATATCLTAGPVVAPAFTLTVIVDAVPGWLGVSNDTAAVPGTLGEEDPELRVRRQSELAAGSSRLDSIVSAVRKVDGVKLAKGYTNRTNATDGDGLPAHTFEIVVYGDPYDDNGVAQAIWDNQPAGIDAVHGTAGTLRQEVAVDVENKEHTISWTDAEQVTVYAHVEANVNAETFPVDGDAQIVAAVTSAIQGQNSQIGADVLYTKLYAAVYSIPGVDEVTLLALGTTPSPVTQGNVTIGSRQVAVVGDIEVETTPV